MDTKRSETLGWVFVFVMGAVVVGLLIVMLASMYNPLSGFHFF